MKRAAQGSRLSSMMCGRPVIRQFWVVCLPAAVSVRCSAFCYSCWCVCFRSPPSSCSTSNVRRGVHSSFCIHAFRDTDTENYERKNAPIRLVLNLHRKLFHPTKSQSKSHWLWNELSSWTNTDNSRKLCNLLFWCVAHNAVLTIIGPSHRFLCRFTTRHAETTISYFVFGLSGALDFICFATTQIFCKTHGAFVALLLHIIIHHRCRVFCDGCRIGCERRRLLFDRRYFVHDFFLFISLAPSQTLPTGIGLCFRLIQNGCNGCRLFLSGVEFRFATFAAARQFLQTATRQTQRGRIARRTAFT